MTNLNRGQQPAPAQTAPAAPVAGESQAQADARAQALEDKARQDELAAQAEATRAAAEERAKNPPPPVPEPEIPPETRPLTSSERTFTAQPDWTPVERDAQGNVTVYTDPSGLRHYTPYSVPWQQGYKQDEPGVHADNPVAEAPYVDVRGVHITKSEAVALNKLRETDPESYVNTAAELGIIPSDAVYSGGRGDEITYTTQSAINEQVSVGREMYKQRADYSNVARTGALTRDAEGNLSINVTQAILQGGKTVQSSLLALGVSQDTIDQANTNIINQRDFEQNTLPTMPAEYQAAYRSGNTAETDRLNRKYQAEYNAWASQFSPNELSEIKSGQYKVRDPKTGEYVAVTKSFYTEWFGQAIPVHETSTQKPAPSPPTYYYRSPTGGLLVVSESERKRILDKYGWDSSYYDRFTRNTKSLAQTTVDWFTTQHPSMSQLAGAAGKKISDYLESQLAKVRAEPEIPGILDNAGRLLSSSSSGIALAASNLVFGFPSFVENALANPSALITAPGEMLHGITTTSKKMWSGGYRGEGVLHGDVSQVVQDTIMAYIAGEMMVAPAGAGVRGLQFARTVVDPKYRPLRSMSTEASTLRVPFTEEQLLTMRRKGVTEADIIDAGTKINEQLVSGKKVAEVELGGIKVRVKSSPLQVAQGGLSIYSSMPDITLLQQGGSVPVFKTFWGSAKVAIEPLQRSYLEGVKATNPGIAEIRIADASIIRDIMPQKRLIGGGTVIEPEMPIPSLDQLQGMGYRLDPIPGAAGRGVTFDATVGPVQIQRFTLSKVTGDATGLKSLELGGTEPTGTIAIGDLHGTSNFKAVFDDINAGSAAPVIRGDPARPATWEWAGGKQTLVILGDSIDRGTMYELWRDTFNRLSDQAKMTGGEVVRLVGNHELAYLTGDAISGVEYTDLLRSQIRKGLIEDVKSGKVKAAASRNSVLFTHAGVSLGVFPELRGLKADSVAVRLNKAFLKAVEKDKYSGKLFSKGRVESGTGHSYKTPQERQGGIFWLRPQEATLKQLNLGFTQVVGHNPGWSVRRIWGDNFIEVDVGRVKGGMGAYYDTAYRKTQPVEIATEPIPGAAARIGATTRALLAAKAMRDTVADFVIGWDGRIKAWKAIKDNEIAMKAIVKSLQEQIKVRRAAGDSIGVKYLRKQIVELTSPTGSDYLYGGIGFWRDIVMGRQNSVRVMSEIGSASRPAMNAAVGYINNTRNTLSKFSDRDLQSLFGMDRATLLRYLDTSRFVNMSDDALRSALPDTLSRAVEIIDNGLERSVAPYIDDAELVNRYTPRFQDEVGRYNGGYDENEQPYMAEVRSPIGTEQRGITSEETRTPTYYETPPLMQAVRIPPAGRVPPTIPVRVPPIGRVPRTAPPLRVPPVRIPPITPPPDEPALIQLHGGVSSQRSFQLPNGSIAWRQGAFWKYIPPPYDQPKPITLPHGVTPIGAKRTDLRTTKETVQKIGDSDAPVPEKVLADLGVNDLEVSKYGTEINFSGGGMSTDVGEGVPGPAQGMTVEAGELPKGHAYATDYYEPHSSSRPAIAKTSAPPRKANPPELRELRPGIAEEKADESNMTPLEQDLNIPYGTFGDELLPKRRPPVNRPRMSKKRPNRRDSGGNDAPTQMGGMRP